MNYEYRRVRGDDGNRYAVIVIDSEVARIRHIRNELNDRPIVWQRGDATPDYIVAIAQRSVDER